jgi:hypothetical protein
MIFIPVRNEDRIDRYAQMPIMIKKVSIVDEVY